MGDPGLPVMAGLLAVPVGVLLLVLVLAMMGGRWVLPVPAEQFEGDAPEVSPYLSEPAAPSGYGGPGPYPPGTALETYGRDRYDVERYDVDRYGRQAYGREEYGREAYGAEEYGREMYGAEEYDRAAGTRGEVSPVYGPAPRTYEPEFPAYRESPRPYEETPWAPGPVGTHAASWAGGTEHDPRWAAPRARREEPSADHRPDHWG